MNDKKPNILISGCHSGLGKFLREQYDADAYDRNSESAPQTKYQYIIHCASAPAPKPNALAESHYHSLQFELCENLMKINHNKFIFISCTDIYPKELNHCIESDEIKVGDIDTPVGQSKWQCETLVKKKSEKNLILRCSTLVGEDMQKNDLVSILTGDISESEFSGKSNFNIVTHDMVARFINTAINKQLSGIYNLSSNGSIRLEQVAKAVRNHVEFGDITYRTPIINNDKVKAIQSEFDIETLELIKGLWKLHKGS